MLSFLALWLSVFQASDGSSEQNSDYEFGKDQDGGHKGWRAGRTWRQAANRRNNFGGWPGKSGR